MAEREIRADYDERSIIVYQAYRKEIALPAIAQNHFVPPFSLNRMTWIKPSFLWMMERSNWGRKPGQEYILAIRITRQGWEEALSQAVLTTPDSGIYRDADEWRSQQKQALVNIQWDPERTIHGASLPYRSIQVGLSRHIIEKYVSEWTLEIRNATPLVRKISALLKAGETSKAQDLLPKERVYPVSPAIARRLGIKLPE
ncbi:MAG TPA: DUF4291 domain-containing protein [Ktedonobacterales bacterium]